MGNLPVHDWSVFGSDASVKSNASRFEYYSTLHASQKASSASRSSCSEVLGVQFTCI